MNKLSLNITIFLSTFFSPYLFSATPLDDQKEGFSTPTHSFAAIPKQIKVRDYTILNNKNITHTLDSIEDVEEDLGDDVLVVNTKLITSNNQSPPLLLGAVLQHNQTHEYHKYLISDTGLLSEATQPKAVKRAHKTRFHLIKATRGHVSLQLLEWLQISKHYTVTALHTNRPVCRNCYLIANSLWEKKLPTNEKGCIDMTFPLLDKMPTLAQKYINTHLNFSLVQSLVVPIMGYVSKEEMNKVKQKNNEMASFVTSMQEINNTQIAILNKHVKAKDKQLTTLKYILQEKDIKYQQELKKKDDQLEEKDEKINMLNQEVNKKDNQLKKKDEIISDFQSILCKIPKQSLNNKAEEDLFNAIYNNEVVKVNQFLDAYKDIVAARDEYQKTPFLCAVGGDHFAIAKLLKKRGANIHAKDKNGYNALHEACLSSSSVEMVTWLLDVCKIGIETKGGFYKRTPFLCVAQSDTAMLIGANIHTKITIQLIPFFLAAQKKKLAIAKLLKKRGANINAKDVYGNNALYWAFNKEMIDYLQTLGLE